MAETSLSTKAAPETILLRPTRGWSALNLGDLWRYRELIFFLTWRDIKVRYKQTVLGAAWAIIRPVMTMLVYSLIFGQLANLDSEGVPYTIFTYVALLPWQLFSKAMNDTGRSMVSNRNMITKVYFPRLVIPISTVLSGLVDFLIAFIILIGMMIYYDISLTSAIWTLPLFLILTLVSALGVGLWFSSMNVLYRDVGYMLPFLIEMWKYLTPVAYSAQYVTGTWKIIYSLNPMAGVVQGFRWALLGIELDATATMTMSISIGVSILVLISGLFYFRRMERTFADMV
ncbi:MAG: ABC transporter permease [Anaerolineales bacterium]|nr:ABC transporter permease [Chloroflexota bacterium]MBL6979880.1 ABC transporter permease [Anaerolineales bacterium]